MLNYSVMKSCRKTKRPLAADTTSTVVHWNSRELRHLTILTLKTLENASTTLVKFIFHKILNTKYTINILTLYVYSRQFETAYYFGNLIFVKIFIFH